MLNFHFFLKPRAQIICHLLDLIGPRSAVMKAWVDRVSVNAMLAALELENDVTVYKCLGLSQQPPQC
jgi:hypothetical protein